MNGSRRVPLVIFVIASVLLGVVPATAHAPTADDSQSESADPPQGDDVPLGVQISAFMQLNAAGASGTVDSSLWKAEFEATEAPEREAVVRNRTETLSDRVDEFSHRKENVVEAEENGSISELKYRAELGALLGQYGALRAAIDEAAALGERADADVSELRRLDERLRDAAEPELAAVAAETPGVEVADSASPNEVGIATADRRADERRVRPPAAEQTRF